MTGRLPKRSSTVLVAAVGALGAGTATASPTGAATVDHVLLASCGAAIAVLGRRSATWALLVAAGVGAAFGDGAGQLLGFASLIAAVLLAGLGGDREVDHGVITAGALASLLRLGPIGGPWGTIAIGLAAITPVIVTSLVALPAPQRRPLRIGATVVVCLAVAASVLAAVAVLLAVGPLRGGNDAARQARDAAQEGDTEAAAERLAAAEGDLRAADDHLSSWWAQGARLVPGVAQQLRAVQISTTQALEVVETGDLIGSIGDYRDLKYGSGQIDLDRVRQVTPPVQRTAGVVAAAGDEVAAIDTRWLVGPLADRVDDLDEELRSTAEEAGTAAEVLELLPALLGGDGERRYFVAFLNPSEARGLGGFLGNYGELTAVDGRVRLTASGAISDLERPRGERTLDGPAEYLERYGQFDPADYFRDATFSPSLPLDAQVMAALYPQSGGQPVDGVLAMDPYTLAALLEITGPIQVPGYPTELTSENLPEVVLEQQYLDFDQRNQDRKDLLVDATEIAFDRLLEGDLPSPQRLVELLGPMVQQRRLMLWSPDDREQALYRRIGASGEVPAPDGGDVLLISHQNYGNNKLDAYLQRSIAYDVEVDPETGVVDATATIELRNEAPASGLPAYVIGNSRAAPDGTNLMNLSILSALDVQGAELDGEPLTLFSEPEAGLGASDLAISVPPGATSTLVVRLRGQHDPSRGPYRLVLEPRGRVRPDVVTVTVDGEPAEVCADQDAIPLAPASPLRTQLVVGAPGCRP